MKKSHVRKVAQEYVLKHKEHFKTGHSGVTDRDINAAVEKVAKALHGLKTTTQSSTDIAAADPLTP